jgi:hypothetical protein
MRLKSFKNFLIDEELIYNAKDAKPTNTETSNFSNRLVYWNNLPKKFKQGTLTEEEKKDYNRILSARTWWLMTDLENSNIDEKKKKEYQKRFKDFMDALDRAYKKIPDDFYNRNFYDLQRKYFRKNVFRGAPAPDKGRVKGPEKKPNQTWSVKERFLVADTAGEKDTKGKVKFSEPTDSYSKKYGSGNIQDINVVLNKYNDWLETVEMPWNEISSYLGVITRIDQKESPSYETGEIPKLVGQTLNKLSGLVVYLSKTSVGDGFSMSKSEYEEAKSPFGRAKNDAMTTIERIEQYLYSDYYIPRGGEKYRNLIENKIREIEKTFKTKDADSVLKLTEELKKLLNEADFRYKTKV